jgi:hypothetical protein
MAPPGMSNDWDRTNSEAYGLGTERPVELFYKLVLVDVANCVEIKIREAFVLTRRVDIHAIDATPTRWRSDAGSSPLDGANAAACVAKK